jgi:peptidoglycan/xylan/chitin deacetylase (PgdA/CDA1 family)
MQRRTGRSVLAGALALVAATAMACAAAGASVGPPRSGSVGLAAIAGSGVTSSGTTTTPPSPIRVTVPELTAGTIANLTAPVTVPATTAASSSAGPPTTPSAPAAAAPAPPAPAAPTIPVVPPYTTVLGWTGEGNVAYLTFDDGPGPATGQMLDILAAKGVKATFCVVGQRVAVNTDMIRRIVAEGHTVCNHSWDHPAGFDTLAPEVLAGQIGRTQDAVIRATGHTPRYLRAPEGRFGLPDGSVHQAAQQARTLLLGWAVDAKDWTTPGTATIVSNVVGGVGPGAIILMHDAGGADRQQTLEALPGVIDGLRAAGYTLLPLPPDPVG